ncbi:Small integral membrane protein [Citrobacter youngae]|nr:Small integral membrane protein [Citrobacter youngae]
MHHTENIADGQPERSYQAVTLTMVKEKHMFRWGIIFLVIALIAAALGFGGLAGTAAGAAKIVFVVGIILFLVSLFTGRKRP